MNMRTNYTAVSFESSVCYEWTFALSDVSGDTNVQTTKALQAVLVNNGHNPFELIKGSVKYGPTSADFNTAW